MIFLERGCYRVRQAEGSTDMASALRIRGRCFAADRGGLGDGIDRSCRHILVEERTTGATVATFRLMSLSSGLRIGESYSSRFYDLSALARYEGRMVELGRFCVDPERHDADILRIAWGALTRMVDREGVSMLFGCTSFPGIDPSPYAAAMTWLARHHLAPQRWRPAVRADHVVILDPELERTDAQVAALAMPPLLRSYLAMGGWVSDHAVIDHEMDTVHVFTGLEISAIPASRARLLRRSAT